MNQLKCQCCNQQKNSLYSQPSQVIPTMRVLICKLCMDAGLEPRFTLILAARQNINIEKVKELVLKGKYLGPKILAEEYLTP